MQLYGIVNQAMGLLQTNTKEQSLKVTPSATQAQPTQAQQSCPPVQSSSWEDSSEHVYSGYTKVKCSFIFIRWMFFIKILEQKKFQSKTAFWWQDRPLELLGLLLFFFSELVNEMFPGTERETINQKISHILKPSGGGNAGK